MGEGGGARNIDMWHVVTWTKYQNILYNSFNVFKAFSTFASEYSKINIIFTRVSSTKSFSPFSFHKTKYVLKLQISYQKKKGNEQDKKKALQITLASNFKI